MTTDELRAAYPGAPDAVELHEIDMDDFWPRARASGMSPAAVAIMMAREVGDTVTGTKLSRPGIPLRPQMEHPDFLRYVTAKMGGM